MSYHSHDYREEVWTVVSGSGKAVVDGMEQKLRVGDVITIAAGCKHTVIAETDLDIVEVQIGETLSVEDKESTILRFKSANIKVNARRERLSLGWNKT